MKTQANQQANLEVEYYDEVLQPEATIVSTAISVSESLIPLEVIRTENVISKFPVHNLAKTGRVSIRLMRKRNDGEVEFQWEVTYNEKYGEAKQLAYQIDTLIIAKRIYDLFESGQSIPQIIPIGSLYQICQELGMNPQSGKNKNNVKRALSQNAGAFIDAKIKYKDRSGEERNLNAQFSRYAVVHRDQKLPDGRRADQVYLVLQPIYHEVLNTARWRPLNFSYLKELPPASQRCYEIISTRLFAAIKYGHASAEIAYSDYCAFSAQTRQTAYKSFRAQMDHVHKPHLISGYLEKVEFRQTVDPEGRIDWIITYFPGTKARAEFSYFNPRLEGFRGKSSETSLEGTTASVKTGIRQSSRSAKRIAQKLNAATEPEVVNPEAIALVRYFHTKVHSLGSEYEPLKRELTQADQLLSLYGKETAEFIVDYACAEAPKTQFDMQVFGAVLVYEKRALNKFKQRNQAQPTLFQSEVVQAAKKSDEALSMDVSKRNLTEQASDISTDVNSSTDPMQVAAEKRYAQLSPDELAEWRMKVETEIKRKIGDKFERMWDEEVREQTIKANILKLLATESSPE